jgi:hypothetical protein
MSRRFATTLVLLTWILPAGPAAREEGSSVTPASGPIVSIPDCRIVDGGCGLDPDTPALSPGACASTLATFLDRRGVRSTLPGPVTDICSIDPNAVAVLGTITATCPAGQGGKTPLHFARRTRLAADVEIRDCASGKSAGSGHTDRSMGAGRWTLLRDAVEELGHHLSSGEIRSTHPATPLGWVGADVGNEYSVELRGGFVDVRRSGINDFFRAAGVAADTTATRETLELAHHPWGHQRIRFAVGVDAMQIQTSGRATFNTALLHLSPPTNLSSARLDATLRAIAPELSASYGWDYTRHQRISIGGSIGWYLLGTAVAPSKIQIEGTPFDSLKLRDSAWGLGAEARWDWRLTSHIGIDAAWGWNDLSFRHPRQTRSNHFLPLNVDFTGKTGRLGIAARF